MFMNYLLIAWYNLKRQPVFSAIKVLSLAIGLGCSGIVIMHVQYALSFDRNFKNAESIYRVVTDITTDRLIEMDGSSDAVAPQMRLDYPEIPLIGKVRGGNGLFARNGEDASANGYIWAEPEIIDIFTLEFVSGDPDTALDEPNSVVLTEATAAKYFPGEQAVGQTLTMDERAELRVTGVMRDLPQNSYFRPPMLISVATGQQMFGPNFMGGNAWVGFQGTNTYVMIPDKAEAQRINDAFPDFITRNIPEQQGAFAASNKLKISLQPLLEIYLGKRAGFGTGSNRAEILAGLAIFATLILLTSCINFANLSLAQVQQRNKEIGVRKTLGAKRGQIVFQFLFESLLLTLIALLIAAPAVYFALPVYTALTSTDFTLGWALRVGGVWTLPLFVILTGALSGLLPALALSRFDPAATIKGLSLRGRMSGLLRSGVTVVQFGFSTALIILALAISLQIRHLNTMDLGFDKNNLVVLDSTYNIQDADAFDYDAMVNELGQHPGILQIGRSQAPPPSTGAYNPWCLPSFAPGEFRPVSHLLVSENFFDTMGFTLLAGRWFSEDFPTDFTPNPPINAGQPPAPPPGPPPERGIVITRAAVANFGLGSPEAALGQVIMPGGGAGGCNGPQRFHVIGVIEDFRQSGGLEDPAQSTSILRATQDPMRVLLLRIDPTQMDSALAHVDEVWARHRPDVPLSRTFFSQTFGDLVQAQTNGISKAAVFASIVTVIISAMGLYALAFYSTQRRTKEVGIRKVMGATSKKIVYLLTWDFLKPVLLACALASVVGYFAVDRYFEQFSSRITVPIWVYLAVSAGTVLVAIVTVAFQCFRAANADPVKSLRYE
jgi:putative ABC transport system permease protein